MQIVGDVSEIGKGSSVSSTLRLSYSRMIVFGEFWEGDEGGFLGGGLLGCGLLDGRRSEGDEASMLESESRQSLGLVQNSILQFDGDILRRRWHERL